MRKYFDSIRKNRMINEHVSMTSKINSSAIRNNCMNTRQGLSDTAIFLYAIRMHYHTIQYILYAIRTYLYTIRK